MKAYRVIISGAAERDLAAIARYIAQQSSRDTARGFIERLKKSCQSLADAPFRGSLRDDLGVGLRTFGVERRATILIAVDEQAAEVVVLGVFYGGRAVKAPAGEE